MSRHHAGDARRFATAVPALTPGIGRAPVAGAVPHRGQTVAPGFTSVGFV